MEEGVRVVLGIESGEVAEEVMHLIDRSGRARVVASADDDRRLAEAVRQLEPDVVLAQPTLCGSLDAGRHALVAIDTRESVGSLRAALSLGARGYFVWPADRDAAVAAIVAAGPVANGDAPRGVIVGLHAARGGAGATFLATNLAGVAAGAGRSCILVDTDAIGADVGPSIGAPEEGPHTAAVLLRMGEELASQQLADALWPHPSGFRALLAPTAGDSYRSADAWRRVIGTAAGLAEVVFVDLGADPTYVLRSCVDRVLEVLTPEVRSFRAAARLLDAAPAVPVDFILNRAGRAELVPGDVERAFGAPAIGVVPADPQAARGQAAGRLVSGRGRTGRAISRLSRTVLHGREDEREPDYVQSL
jgi:MinD-like ATPase involved in chromosome partitioning or flagellar assembly